MKIKNVLAVLGVSALAAMATTACFNKNATNESTSANEAAQSVNYGTIKLGEYKGIELSIIDTTVTDDEVESQIQNMLTMYPNKVAVEGRAVADGDTVNIDYEGKVDGVAFEGGTAKAQDLVIGSGNFIPGFEEQLIGANKGETKDLNLTFPTEYHNADLAGKAAVFTVTVNDIFVNEPAVLDDAWVEKTTAGEYKTVSDYRDSIRKSLEDYKRTSSETSAQQSGLLSVVASSTFEISEEGINAEYAKVEENYTNMLQSYNMDMKQLAEMNGMSEEEFKAEMRKTAEEAAKKKLVVDEIFKLEKLAIEDADYTALEEQTGMKINDMKLQYGEAFIDSYLRELKVSKLIVDNAKKTTVTQETAPAAVETVAEETSESTAESSAAEGEEAESSASETTKSESKAETTKAESSKAESTKAESTTVAN